MCLNFFCGIFLHYFIKSLEIYTKNYLLPVIILVLCIIITILLQPLAQLVNNKRSFLYLHSTYTISKNSARRGFSASSATARPIIYGELWSVSIDLTTEWADKLVFKK